MPLDAPKPAAHAATEALQAVMRSAYKPIWEAGSAYAAAHAKAVKATDIVETMQDMVSVILAAEHLNEVALEAAKATRAKLAEVMSDVGCPHVQVDNLLAYVSRKTAWVSVDQPDMLPAEYMRQPEPVIDKRAIKAAIEAGEDVPGCSLVRPNDVSLVIRQKGA